MSKKVKAHITCKKCKKVQDVELFRSLWIDQTDNRQLVFDDRVNYFTYDNCNHSERLKFPFIATNTKKKIAVWYEPYHDPQIDKDISGYT